MKLLITTQAVDQNDPVMGFFHRWIEALALHAEVIHVICLKEGVHDLPSNVKVYSLGKEKSESRIKYVVNFFRYLYLLRGEYDRVFAHMNPHYVVLAGLYWRLKKIPIFFWRNHARMNMMTRIAARFASGVFYTSPFACTSRYAHAHQMPVGIDTDFFTPPDTAISSGKSSVKKILFLGRLSPVKRVELFVDVAAAAPPSYEFHIYGDAPLKDRAYEKMLHARAGGNVFFHAGIKNSETPKIYRAHDVYLNLTPEGSMDKTVLEAASCGVPTLVSNTSFGGILPDAWIVTDTHTGVLCDAIQSIVGEANHETKRHLETTRIRILEKHSLAKLASMLYNYMQIP